MAMLFESPDSQNQLNAGITMIQAAFASLTSSYNKELTYLNQELQMKTNKINDLEKCNKALHNEKEQNETMIHKLMHENKRLIKLEQRGEREGKEIFLRPNDFDKKTIEPEHHDYHKEHYHNSIMAIPQSAKHSLKTNKSASNLLIKGNNKPSNSSIANIDDLLAGFDETITKIKKYNNKNLSNNKGGMSSRPSHEIRKKLFNQPKNILNNDEDKDDMWINNINENSKDGHNGCHTNRERRTGSANSKNAFFIKCRAVMNSKDYTQMIEIMRLTNSHMISKQETYNRITLLMEKKYRNLLEEFNKLII